MKVFKLNDCDWVCADSIVEARNWYMKEYKIDAEDCLIEDIEECDIEKETMWQGFDFIGDRNLSSFLSRKKDREYKIKYDRFCDYDCLIKLTFKEVIEIDNIKEPYLIATTEI